MGSPRKEIRPLVGSYTPVMQLKAVVLPAPLGPIRATISPWFTSRDRSFTATTPPNCMVTCSSRRTFSTWLISPPLSGRLAAGKQNVREFLVPIMPRRKKRTTIMMMTEKTTIRKPVRSRGTVREPLMMKKASQTSRARAARETSSSFQTFWWCGAPGGSAGGPRR